MRALQSQKSNSTEPPVKPQRTSSDKNGDSLSAFLSEQLDFNNKSDVIRALNYILPYFLEGNLEATESLLPLIKLPFANVQCGDMPLSHVKNH